MFLKFYHIHNANLEIASMADLPSGTGLGSSGSFTTALIKACHLYKKNISYPEIIANDACKVEIDILKEPIGKQDQYISSYGGLSCFDFNKDGSVLVTPLKISKDSILNLEENLLLFFTGFSRSASKILKNQVIQSEKNENSIIENLHEVKEIGYQSKRYLENDDLNSFANLMNDHWKIKKKRSKIMTNEKIDSYYQSGIDNGAIGGKVIGAGGGGFLMFYASDKKLLRNKMQSLGLIEINFQFEFEGTKSIVSS